MAKKKSSFHMGDEFNGSGKKTYLRATQHNTYAPLLQHNVRLTPDFSRYVPVAIGGIPISTEEGTTQEDGVGEATGSVANVSKAVVRKKKKGKGYDVKFEVGKIQLTDGSYLHSEGGCESEIEDFLNDAINEQDDLEQYIKEIITNLGWTTDDEEVKEVKSILEAFQITDRNSIACFLLLSISEAGAEGLYTNRVDKEGKSVVDEHGRAVTEYYPDNYYPGYGYEERGVGYMQITFTESHKKCLKCLKEMGYYNEDISNISDYVEVLREMPWQTSAWRWAVYVQTKDGNLNRYIEARANENGGKLTLGMVLAAESFINGKVSKDINPREQVLDNTEMEYGSINDALCNIANGIVPYDPNGNGLSSWYTEGGHLYIGGWKYETPNNWNNFKSNYFKLFPAEVEE